MKSKSVLFIIAVLSIAAMWPMTKACAQNNLEGNIVGTVTTTNGKTIYLAERLNFAIVLKKEDKLIGGIDVVGYLGGVNGTPVIGYNLARKYWGSGYMTEACRCVIEYLFSKGYPEIRIDAMSENAASIRVIQKCGGIFLKTDEDYLPLKDKTVLVNRYIVKNKFTLI